MIAFVVWDVENMWLQNNLIWISSCREMKGAWVLRNKKTGKFYGLRTHKTHHGASLHQVMQPEKAIWVFRMPILGGCALCTGMVRKLFNILIG
jgi:hypothetical protein